MTKIELMTPDSWERVRDLRLRALQRDPDAFEKTYEEEIGEGETFWRQRLTGAFTWIAFCDGAEAGMVTGAPMRGHSDAAGLFGMWVDPTFRGQGVGAVLVQGVIDWARAGGYARLLLEMGERNQAASGLYKAMGFVPTGVVGTLPEPRAHLIEVELEILL
jgi:GNAT superfamily N-acetyltransferase